MAELLKFRAPDLAEGTMSAVGTNGRAVLLVRTGNRYYAVPDRCPACGEKLSDGKLEDGVVVCPHRDIRVDLSTGEVYAVATETAGNGARKKPPLKVPTYPVRTRGTEVWLEIPVSKGNLDMLNAIRNVQEEHNHLWGLYARRIDATRALDTSIRFLEDSPEKVAEYLKSAKAKTEEVVRFIDDSLMKHHVSEEMILAPIFGRTLIRGVMLEHREIHNSFEEFRKTILGIWSQVKSVDQMALTRAKLERIMDALQRKLEIHRAREENLMKMAKKALVG